MTDITQEDAQRMKEALEEIKEFSGSKLGGIATAMKMIADKALNPLPETDWSKAEFGDVVIYNSNKYRFIHFDSHHQAINIHGSAGIFRAPHDECTLEPKRYTEPVWYKKVEDWMKDYDTAFVEYENGNTGAATIGWLKTTPCIKRFAVIRGDDDEQE